MKRKHCNDCGKPFLAFQKHYLHPETPCNGIKDTIHIQAEIDDELVQKKFQELYGSPILDDYELLNRIYNNLILRFLIRLFIRKKNK